MTRKHQDFPGMSQTQQVKRPSGSKGSSASKEENVCLSPLDVTGISQHVFSVWCKVAVIELQRREDFQSKHTQTPPNPHKRIVPQRGFRVPGDKNITSADKASSRLLLACPSTQIYLLRIWTRYRPGGRSNTHRCWLLHKPTSWLQSLKNPSVPKFHYAKKKKKKSCFMGKRLFLISSNKGGSVFVTVCHVFFSSLLGFSQFTSSHSDWAS